MLVNNHFVSRQLNNSQSQITTGDIGSVLIKDRYGSNEANVLFKGQEYRAKFEGAVPSSDRMLAEVVGMPEKGKLLLRDATAGAKSQQNQSIEERLANAGIDPVKNTNLMNAVKILDAKAIPLSNENLVDLKNFIDGAEGTVEGKLETVKVAAQKNLPVTGELLKSIHTSLHGPALKDTLLQLSAGTELNFNATRSLPAATQSGSPGESINIEKVLQQLKNGEIPVKEIEAIAAKLGDQSNPDIQKLKQEIIKSLQIFEAGNERISQAKGIDTQRSLEAKAAQLLAEGTRLQRISTDMLIKSLESLTGIKNGQSIDDNNGKNLLMLQSLVKQVQKEPSMTKVLETLGKVLQEMTASKNIDLSILQSTFEKAQQLSAQGRELAARKSIADAITQLEKDNPSLQKGTNQLSLTEAEQYAINESLQSIGLQSKAILVTEISKKLSQMAIDFKKIKQDITKNLDNISSQIGKNGGQANAKQMLDSTINKLDNAILKSNFMLYTDMLTEKKMLTASSRLAEARNLLGKGEFSQANQIVKEVKGVLDNINFKPSTTRVQHFVSEQSLLKSAVTAEEQLAYGIKQAVRPMPDQDYSARQVFESMRKLGLTHENDAARNLVFGSKGNQEELGSNVKSMLIKMAQEGEGQAKAEQALSSLSGQQLLNKQDSSGMQNLFLQLPFLMNQKMENIKVFINSQKSGEKIDWENCSLYFVLETKKLGEVGINVTAQNRNISITFNSGKEDLETRLLPLTEISKERLQEVGYKLDALKAKTTADDVQEEMAEKRQSRTSTPAFTEKGYDFTI
jgi:hypothetical protein